MAPVRQGGNPSPRRFTGAKSAGSLRASQPFHGAGNSEWQMAPELIPLPGETRIRKNFNPSFEKTALEEILAEYGASHIILAGAATNWCIRATAYAALDRGYDLTLLTDAHTTETMEMENGLTIEAEKIINDLNIAMIWLSYPERMNNAVTGNDIDFS